MTTASTAAVQPSDGGWATAMLTTSVVPSRVRREEAIEFRLILLVSFAVFLVAVLVARLLPGGWRPNLPGSEGQLSVIGEARAAARTFAPFAFMG